MPHSLEKWHHTKHGLLTFSAVELLMSYGLASWALDNGSLLLWALTIIFFVGALSNFVRFMIAAWKKGA